MIFKRDISHSRCVRFHGWHGHGQRHTLDGPWHVDAVVAWFVCPAFSIAAAILQKMQNNVIRTLMNKTEIWRDIGNFKKLPVVTFPDSLSWYATLHQPLLSPWTWKQWWLLCYWCRNRLLPPWVQWSLAVSYNYVKEGGICDFGLT